MHEDTEDRRTQNLLNNEASRRKVLKGLAALGLAGPAAMAAIRTGSAGTLHAFGTPGNLTDGIARIVDAAKVPELDRMVTFAVTGSDLPWKDAGFSIEEGQSVTFLLGGRWWIVKDLDVWVEPGLAFFARIGGNAPIYNPMSNTGTMVAKRAGAVSVARSIGDWVDEKAETVATPPEYYIQEDGSHIEGIALIWKGDPLTGLRGLHAHGDVAGALQAEIARLESEPPVPEGWRSMYQTGNAGIFSTCAPGVIGCHVHKNACLLVRDVSLPLSPDATIDWQWNVEELPSMAAEDELLTHDYLSMAVAFDDGQDLTYMWSAALPEGTVFRCPFPRWQPLETHVIVRTGHGELGKWLAESRNIHDDYHQHIGGEAKRIVAVWLIALSVFQRRTGLARFADIVVRGNGEEHRLT